jgi:cell division protein FtsB
MARTYVIRNKWAWIFLAAEFGGIAMWYVIGQSGLRQLRSMQAKLDTSMMQYLASEQKISVLRHQIEEWETKTFPSTVVARQELQMSHPQDIIYYVPIKTNS